MTIFSKVTPTMVKTEKHLAYVLKVDQEEVRKIICNIDCFYSEKSTPKKDKSGNQAYYKSGEEKRRVLNPSYDRLKIIQTRIHKQILSLIKLPHYVFGAVKGSDNIKNARYHQGNKYFFMTDMQSFFPFISNHRVYEMYRFHGFSPTVSRILTQLTTYKGRVPQGAATSADVANLVFAMTAGPKLDALARKNQIKFTSYVDDLTFSSATDFKELVPEIIDIIQSKGFRISPNKTFYKTYKPVVTGVVVKNNSLALTEKLKEKLLKIEGKSIKQIRGLRLYAERIYGA